MSIKRWLPAAAVAAIGMIAPAGLAQGMNDGQAKAAADTMPTLSVFVKVAGVAVPQPIAARRGVVDSQVVMPDIEGALGVEVGRRLRFDLLDGVAPVEAVVTRVERRTPTQLSFWAEDPNDGFKHIHFVVYDGVMVGSVELMSRDVTYRVRYLMDGLHVAQAIDERAKENCGGSPRFEGGDPDAGLAEDAIERMFTPEEISRMEDEAGERGACADQTPSVLDILVCYSSVARAAAGGGTAMLAEIQVMADDVNEVYSNSGLGMRARFVLATEFAYNESGTYRDHLDRITGTSDGFMDGVHSLRSTYGADHVVLLVDDTEYCGLAWCRSDADSAFGVVTWDCGGVVFAHEVGHNQGCAHDRQNADCSGSYSYSYGWRFFGDSGTQWRTVMAYSPGTRIRYFSHPGRTHDGEPTGVTIGQPNESHNAQTIINRRSTVQGFRLTRMDIWVDFSFGGLIEIGTFTFPYDTLSEGVSNLASASTASELPTLWIKEGSTSATMTITKPMTIRACGGLVTIGN